MAGRGWACFHRQDPLPGSAGLRALPLLAPAALCRQNKMLTFQRDDTPLLGNSVTFGKIDLKVRFNYSVHLDKVVSLFE